MDTGRKPPFNFRGVTSSAPVRLKFCARFGEETWKLIWRMGESSGITFCGGGRGAARFFRNGATGCPFAESCEFREFVELYWDFVTCPLRSELSLFDGAANEFRLPAFIRASSAELKLLLANLVSDMGTSRISFRPTSPIVQSLEKTIELSAGIGRKEYDLNKYQVLRINALATHLDA